MYKVFFLFGFFLSSSFAFAQNKGSLLININVTENGDEFRDKKITFYLLKTDSVYTSYNDCNLDDIDWKIDSISEGAYQFKVMMNDTLLLTYHKIIVKLSKTNKYYFNIDNYLKGLSNKVVVVDTVDNSADVKAEMTMNILYGNNDYYQNTALYKNELYSGELAYNFYYPASKYYSVGLKVGGQYSQINFNNDTTYVNGLKTLSKYYSYLDVNAGLINRFTFYNNKLQKKDGLKLDIGILYHFPLFFKQILKVNDDTKMITRHIHTYTDFTAMVRLGFKYVGLQAEYSLTQFLRHGYTEIPQLRVGLVFYIPVVVD